MNILLSPCVPENLVSRDGFSRPVPRQPAHLHTQAESGAYLRDSSRVPRRRPFIKPPYAIGSVPSLSGHAIAYRWRSLPRVRRHRASKPQGSSERVLPWQITMDQLVFASLSHNHYWYEVGVLKVPAVICTAPQNLIVSSISKSRWQQKSQAHLSSEMYVKKKQNCQRARVFNCQCMLSATVHENRFCATRFPLLYPLKHIQNPSESKRADRAAIYSPRTCSTSRFCLEEIHLIGSTLTEATKSFSWAGTGCFAL